MKLLDKLINYIFKIMSYTYPTYLILGIILLPLIFIFAGFSGIKESYIDSKDLSYKRWKECKSCFWEDK